MEDERMDNRFESFVNGITVCYKYIQKIKSIEMTEFGLKGTHVMCVFYLHRNPEGLTAAQLSNRCEEDKAAISRTLSELEEKGYIRSVSGDSKKKYRSMITLSPKGEELAEKVEELIEQWVNLGGDGLSESEREAFYYALGIISDNLRTKTKERI